MAKMTKAELEIRIADLEKLLADKDAEIARLSKRLGVKDAEIERLKKRGAGRTPVFSDREKDEIFARSQEGISYRAIAKEMGCSAALVCNVVKEYKNIKN